MNATAIRRKLKGKDLITIGIFSAIYFVINFVFMLMGGFHPIMWVLMPGLIALFTGIPFMLMAAKVQKPGAVFLMGLIVGLIYFITGQFTVMILITFVIACGAAELVRHIAKHGSSKGNTAAFVCFSLGMVGLPLPIWLMRDSFLAQIAEQGIPAVYISALEALISPVMFAVLFAAPIVGAMIGTFITRSLFKKHFEKAGIV
ncbi:MAG: MptD family putative ECF transporter S component [Clostridiales bacterium]|jgi:energy-coupling factor transport system substrate-specific component|nr:MptD family putative ECF transporter S component [Clostridiales bacterium]